MTVSRPDLNAIEHWIGLGPFVPGSVYGDMANLIAEVRRLQAVEQAVRELVAESWGDTVHVDDIRRVLDAAAGGL